MLDFKGKDILDGAQFTREEIEHILDVAEDMRERLEKNRSLNIMEGYVLGALFFEPSTRTRLSFETAMHRLGGSVVGFASAGTSSSAKGESLADTIRNVDQYVDVIAMRHPQIGSARIAAEVAESPVINGGDGAGQHPTQALLDLFTIRSERGQVDGNTITLCGDLKYGRTVHAGVELYKHYDCKLIFVAPDALKMPPEITARLRDQGVEVEETTVYDPHSEGAVRGPGGVQAAQGQLHSDAGDGGADQSQPDDPPPFAACGRNHHRRGRLTWRGLLPPSAERGICPHGPDRFGDG